MSKQDSQTNKLPKEIQSVRDGFHRSGSYRAGRRGAGAAAADPGAVRLSGAHTYGRACGKPERVSGGGGVSVRGGQAAGQASCPDQRMSNADRIRSGASEGRRLTFLKPACMET